MGVLTTGLAWLLASAASGDAPAEPIHIVLDGDWAFTWTAASPDDIPAPPAPAAFDVTAAVPGAWDEQLDRFASAAWWEHAVFTTTIEPVRYLTGTGWYRRMIDVPQAWEGRAAQLRIGGAVGQVHVWLNGEHAGTYDYGVYTPWTLDVTNRLQFGRPNEILISVDNTRGFAGGWAFIGNAGKATGIMRAIVLDIAPSAGRVADLYIRPGVDLKQVAWQVELEAPGGEPMPASSLAWEVRDAANQAVLAQGEAAAPAFVGAQRVSWAARIEDILPWSPDEPNLYWARLRWVAADGSLLDGCEQRFGLRRWTHEGRRLFLNGAPIYLRGDFGAYYFPVHCTTPVSKDFWLQRIARTKEAGMNYINFAARVCPIEMMEAADELGIVLQCGDHMTVLEQHRDRYEEVWTPLVRLCRRYPSLGLFGFGGERDYYDGIIAQFQRQYDLIKSLHPECLVMPQQAIRGVDYAFDDEDKKALTPEPFPHHAERLAEYTRACDIFGHYSGGAFGYNYFAEPWREMERRFAIYDKPLSMHELFMGMSYLNPDNAAKYTGRVPPYLYTKLRDDLARAGLLDRWRTYSENSARLQAICQKYCVEKTRKCNELAGYEYLGMTDMHFCPHYTVGMLDEFAEPKPGGDTLQGIRRYNNESVLLLDFAGDSINRSFWAGQPFEAEVMISAYGDGPIDGGRLVWELNEDGGAAVLGGEWVDVDAPNGRVTTLGTLRIQWPAVPRTTRLNLSLHLVAPGYHLANDWDFWVFPQPAPPDIAADADPAALELLHGRYSGLRTLTEASTAPFRIVSRLTQRDAAHLADGGDVLLLGAAPFPEYTAWRSFRPGLGAREHHNVGTVLARHPVFESLPHDGWGDWQFYPILEGAACALFDELDAPFDPILEIISSAEHVRKQAALFEYRVGKGRLLVSTCIYDPANPSCVALMDGMLRYATGPAFQPQHLLPVAVLERLIAPAEERGPHNLVGAPGFEDDTAVAASWLPYGADYALDAQNAHEGAHSLRLTIAPEQLRSDPNLYTGAQAAPIRFQRTPEELVLSAWHKTEGITGDKGRDFLLFAYVAFKDGGRHTLRLPLTPGTHDWELASTTWRPGADVVSATLYIGLARKAGTAWIDDVYFGPKPPEAGVEEAPEPAVWHREPVTIPFGAEGWFRLNGGEWQRGAEARIAQEGTTTLEFRRAGPDAAVERREVRIDVTPPVIVFNAHPALEQEGGIYYARRDTRLEFQAEDALSGVHTLEVSVDGGSFAPYDGPLQLAPGEHRLRCRATDAAGNASVRITGPALSAGSEAESLAITVR
ncbi:MAG: hypothetical protein JXR94_04935 [Candidatus Hydrogenedentes bacterium]|nr:hypothetical protein [Candidatus Hydrogenedentota bacterium]